jgi:hypothetical protein
MRGSLPTLFFFFVYSTKTTYKNRQQWKTTSFSIFVSYTNKHWILTWDVTLSIYILLSVWQRILIGQKQWSLGHFMMCRTYTLYVLLYRRWDGAIELDKIHFHLSFFWNDIHLKRNVFKDIVPRVPCQFVHHDLSLIFSCLHVDTIKRMIVSDAFLMMLFFRL